MPNKENGAQQNTRRVPERRCIGCSEHFPKNQLVRVVRTPGGEILLDKTGKLSGRGAYLCGNPACLKKAQKTRRLENAFSCPIGDEVYQALEEAMNRADR